jgi:hypothetical protein
MQVKDLKAARHWLSSANVGRLHRPQIGNSRQEPSLQGPPAVRDDGVQGQGQHGGRAGAGQGSRALNMPLILPVSNFRREEEDPRAEDNSIGDAGI